MPSALLGRHLTAMLRGPLSVPVVYGTVRVRGLYDHDAQLVDDGIGGEVRRDARVLLIERGALPDAVRQNSRLTVDGASFEVRAVLPQEDGTLLRYVLAPVTGT